MTFPIDNISHSKHPFCRDMATPTKCKVYSKQRAPTPSYDEHPYMTKLRTKRTKLCEILNQIFDIVDTDLVVFDWDTGLNDYNKNKKFADVLDDLSKQLVILSKTCTDHAAKLHEKISDAEDQKWNIQDVIFVQEVVKDAEKAEIAQSHDPIRYKSSHILNIKTENRYTYLSDEQSEDELLNGLEIWTLNLCTRNKTRMIQQISLPMWKLW